jgi:hypothetical protein
MPFETATNPSTGEKVVLVGNEWKPYTQSATNAQGGKAFLVGNNWLTDEGIPNQRSAAPAPAAPMPAQPELTTGQKIYQAVRPYVAPTVEMLGGAGGAVVGGGAGSLLGPVGTATGAVGGAGLGYGMAKELLELGDVYLGGKAPRQGAAQVVEPVRNVLEGSTFEAGGRVLGPIVAKGFGKLMDLRSIPTNKAADIARNALGPDMPEVINALRASQGTGQSAAQATAQINSPTWQALIDRATARDPRFLRALEQSQGEVSLNALAKLAGGTTATETRAANELAKQTLKDITSPARQASLARANKGMNVAALEAEAGEQAAGATSKVQQVRNLESGKNKAIDAYYKYGVDDATGQIVPTQQATHMGNLAKDAERWAVDAANASLDLGQGARFAQAAADSLRAAGIKPLESGSLVQSLRAVTNNPEFAGNDILAGAVKTVADDIAKWTSQGGIIDARALDAIRKNSVNAAIQQLRPGVDATTQRNLAASVMAKIKPMLVDAIEASGGKGYRAYLKEYTEGMQEIAKQKLSGEAQRLWKTDKDAFVRLVQGESPDVVEKILGPGNYNIATELAEDTMQVLQTQAQKRLTELSVKGQVTAGQDALKQLLLDHTSKLRLPSYLSAVAATTNKAIAILENKIGKKTMGVLTEALKTPEGAANLLERLPPEERNRVLKIISDPDNLKGQAATVVKGARSAVANAIGSNALAPTHENALVE